MTSLDARARRAAASIHTAAAGYPLPADLTRARRRATTWRAVRRSVAATAMVGAFVAIAAATAPPAPEPPPPGAPDVSVTTPPPEPATSTPPPEPAVRPNVAPAPAPRAPAEPAPVPPEVAADVVPPSLTVTFPSDGQRFDESHLRFRGTTEPGATVSAGPYEATVASDGSWEILLVLAPGGNRAVFAAQDAAGNEAVAEVTVYYDPPPAATTTTKVETEESPPPDEPPPPTDEKPPPEEEPPAEDVGFSAHQVQGESDDDPPWDVFWGTARPDTLVTVESPHGGGTAEVAPSGDWELKVFFEHAPPGEPFEVVVRDADGHEASFEFVAVS